jgi:TatD DNase family protein
MLIDTHAHVNFNAYKDDADGAIRRSLENDIWMINIGSQYNTSKRAVEIAKKYKQGVYAAIALHPIHLGPSKFIDEEEVKFKTREERFDKEKYKKLAKNPKVVAIGETGLDYYYVNDQEEIKNLQKKVFKQHLELAKELNKPVVFHCRKAYNDLLYEIQDTKYKLQGALHCFMGKKGQAEEFLKMGFYLGFNGLITYCRDYDKVIRNIPLEKILIETDCPYLTPAPHRGKRNKPLYVKYVAEKIAEIKGVSFEKVAEQTTKNARELFGI